MKYIYLTLISLPLIFLSGCATRSIESGQRLDERRYVLIYPLSLANSPSILPEIVHRGAKLTLASGYEKFVFFQDESIEEQAVIVIYMYNGGEDVPWELMAFEEFDAKEYSEKRYIPLGLMRNAT